MLGKAILLTSLFIGTNTVLAASNWIHHLGKDKFTDQKTGTMKLASSDGKNKFGQNYVLVVRCVSEEDLDIYIDWNQFMDKESIKVDIRFDSDKPTLGMYTSASTDGTASFIHYSARDRFLRNLKESKRLIAKGYNYEKTNTTPAIFTLNNFKQTFEKTCGWHTKTLEEALKNKNKELKNKRAKDQEFQNKICKTYPSNPGCPDEKKSAEDRASDQEFQNKICQTYPNNPGCPDEKLTIPEMDLRVAQCDYYPRMDGCDIDWKARIIIACQNSSERETNKTCENYTKN